jgi:hypothetical protein
LEEKHVHYHGSVHIHSSAQVKGNYAESVTVIPEFWKNTSHSANMIYTRPLKE